MRVRIYIIYIYQSNEIVSRSIEKKYISRIFVQNSIFNNIGRVMIPKTMLRQKLDTCDLKFSKSYLF